MAITLKKLSGDTEVIANPTLDGTETALSGLQIDGVKYAMGGGDKLYEHNIKLQCFRANKYLIRIYFKIYNHSSEQFTKENIRNYLYNKVNNGIGVSGFYVNKSKTSAEYITVYKIVATRSDFTYYMFGDLSNTMPISEINVYDEIIEV